MSFASNPLSPALTAPLRDIDTVAGRVSCFVGGPAEGSGAEQRPLLLLHSMNAAPSAMEIRPLFNHFRDRRPVFAPDLPGFGLSDRADIDYSPALYADTLVELVDSLADRPVDVVALSTTAEFAARAALAAPDRFASLTLVSPTGLGRRNPPAAATSERVRSVLRLPALGQGLYRLLTTRVSIRYFLAMSFNGDPPDDLIEYAWATTRQPGARYAPFCFLSGRMFTAHASAELYEKLPVDTLILYDQDPNVSFDKLPGLLASNPRVSARRIAPTRGLPHWEKPEETAEALETFWQALAGSGK